MVDIVLHPLEKVTLFDKQEGIDLQLAVAFAFQYGIQDRVEPKQTKSIWRVIEKAGFKTRLQFSATVKIDRAAGKRQARIILYVGES